jgi:transcriptional regulator with XRE-family HTH domain
VAAGGAHRGDEYREARDEYAAIRELRKRNWIAAHIRERRYELDLTQRELAERAGTSHSFISKLESGAHIPTIPVLQRILAVLDEDLSSGSSGGFPVRDPSARSRPCQASLAPDLRCPSAPRMFNAALRFGGCSPRIGRSAIRRGAHSSQTARWDPESWVPSLPAHFAMTAYGRHAQDGGKLMSNRSLCLYPNHVGTPEGWPR